MSLGSSSPPALEELPQNKRNRKRKRAQPDEDEEWEPSPEEKDEESENRAPRDESDEEWTPSTKRRRSNAGKAVKSKGKKGKKSATKKKRTEILTKKRVGEIRKELNAYARTFAQQVNRDWHDGYEEQGETLCEWFAALEQPLNLVYQFAIIHKRDFDRCNEIMKIVVDTWDNIHAVPARCDIDEALGDSDCTVSVEFKAINDSREFGSCAVRSGIISEMWALLITAAAASELSDDEIHRFIKDASDNDIASFTNCENGDEENIIPKHSQLADGITRLEALVEQKSVWNELPSTKKVHRMRRAIDRRFDGDLHLRTRDYHLRDENDDCLLM